MGTPHKATPEQWEAVRKTAADRFGSYPSHSVITELADRLAAAEQRISDLEAGRSCTCHPDDNPPVPCARRYALDECCEAASAPADHFADANKMVATDAELERVFYEAEGTAAADGFRALYNLGRQHGAAQAASSTPEQPPAAPAPAGGLVERLMDEGYAVTHARAAILAAADYMDNHDWPNAARWLREEVQRHG